ncbi:uncharacterized protein LOC129343057 isoform X2 [Eublepharis macularius]|uniref:Uncharacterized protein LOC129343057 isoform X2 n=1 Tax=Eublepharis macularius TaxID=481883 RepID=A0AA97LGY6_EUBMA|nr:uncharacterized protein LOC129343057 isoform X2 [Eublepharis macularius]
MRGQGGRRGLAEAAPLLALLLLLAALEGASSHPVQRPVVGDLGGSVSLQVSVPPGTEVARIEWDFQPGSGQALVIAEFTPGQWERPNPEDRFGPRLEKADETTLRIQALAKEDSGVYTAHVRYRTAEVQEHVFLLQVSDESGPGGTWMLHLLWLFAIPMPCFVICIWKRCKKFEKYGMKVFEKVKKSKNGDVCPQPTQMETLSGQESNLGNPPQSHSL